ncbi:MAG: DUF4288 domain-containing protein [Betaproteobacteria bacterium]|nr:DUF4288 domain-containing protein [Betaproteobacteria bacterium]
MAWYVASVIMSIKKKEGKQKNLPVYENFVLVEGDDSDQALEKTIAIARNEASANGNMWLDGKPARMVFEGIRKLITISNPVDRDLDSSPPATGTELTYSQYLIKTKTQLKHLVSGKAVNIKYIE